jgi:hypothetical protein
MAESYGWFLHTVSLIGAKEIYQMSNSNLKKPGGGSRARKVDPPRSQKPDQAPSVKPAPQPEDRPVEAAIAAPAVVQIPAVAPHVAAVTPVNTPSIDFQVIAMAYGNYTRKSLEQTKSFFDKLAGVRSLDKAIEIQAEFVRQACETFVTESQAIRELYNGLARQNFQRFEGTVARMIPAVR